MGHRKDPLDRFMSKVSKNSYTQCWEWSSCTQGGYGTYWCEGEVHYAHRWLYERMNGSIDPVLELDHLCRVKGCVNPDHLEPVTYGDNTRRGRNWNRVKTHCPAGHPYEGSNVSYKGKRRVCKACARAYYHRTKLFKKSRAESKHGPCWGSEQLAKEAACQTNTTSLLH